MKSQLLQTGGTLDVDDHSMICSFPSPRLVLSTSLYNGGYLMADAVFNHRLTEIVNSEKELPGGNMENYLALVAKDRGLPSASSTGLLTSAKMDCRGYSVIGFKGTVVEIVATAGVDENAVRAGDAACYYEDDGDYQPIETSPPGGTINILAFTNISLPRGAMAKALLGITEAKTAALQELAVMSPLTLNPATGTGTDGMILACDPTSPVVCTDTGTQSKLGELFCRAAKAAVKQSLCRQCNIDLWRQGSVSERMHRLNIAPGTDPDLSLESTQAKVLLAISQSIRQEYCWGLLGIDELYYFFNLLENPALQPFGSFLAAALRQNRTVYCKESLFGVSRGAS